jgi:hypothetical protein
MSLKNPEHFDIPIVQTAYQLTLNSYLQVGGFPKQLRLTFQERLSWVCHDLLEDLLTANSERDLSRRQDWLLKIMQPIPALRLTLRLAFDLKCLSHAQLAEMSRLLEDFNHQLAAWAKWHDDKIKAGAQQKSSYGHLSM